MIVIEVIKQMEVDAEEPNQLPVMHLLAHYLQLCKEQRLLRLQLHFRLQTHNLLLKSSGYHYCYHQSQRLDRVEPAIFAIIASNHVLCAGPEESNR